MPINYEESNGKRNYLIAITKEDAKDLSRDFVIPFEDIFEKGTSKKLNISASLELGNTKFAEIDRKYLPRFGLPIEETDKIEFVLRNSLYSKFRREGILTSKLPNGTVTLQIEEANF